MGIGVEIPFPTLVEVVVGGKVLVGVEDIGTTTGLDVVEVTNVEDKLTADDDCEEETNLELELGLGLGPGAGSSRASTQ